MEGRTRDDFEGAAALLNGSTARVDAVEEDEAGGGGVGVDR